MCVWVGVRVCVCLSNASTATKNLGQVSEIADYYARTQADNNKAVPKEWAAASNWIARTRGDDTVYVGALLLLLSSSLLLLLLSLRLRHAIGCHACHSSKPPTTISLAS
jgi:hypothetical protein